MNPRVLNRLTNLSVGVALFVIVAVLSAAGCASRPMVMRAVQTRTPVKIDGRLDDPVWQNAPVYELALGRDMPDNHGPAVARTVGQRLREKGNVQLAWDNAHLYVGVRFEDSDICAEGNADQLHHYKLGDTLEVFIKPADDTWYCEFFATPLSRKSHWFYPSRGRAALPSRMIFICDLQVAATFDGTINQWRDRDGAWEAEMAIPVPHLVRPGKKWGPGTDWRVLVARYNHGRYLPMKELSSVPRLSETKFHLYEEYGVIHFDGASPRE